MIEAYFGLKKAPFRLGTDESFYFDSSMHERALAYLKYGLQQAEGLVVLTGETGVGKTTLIEHFLVEFGSQVIASKLLATGFEPGEMLPQVMTAFGADERGDNFAARMKALESYFIGQKNAGHHIVLVVDEAQNLASHSLEELRLLSTLSHNGEALLQIFLVGQPELRTRLNMPEMTHLNQRVVVSWTLKALNEEEMADYIDHRLLMAGWEDEQSLFTDQAMGKIFQATHGVPRLVNRLCARLLVGAALSDADYIDQPLVEQILREMEEEGIEISAIHSADENIEEKAREGDSEETSNAQSEEDVSDMPVAAETSPAIVLPFVHNRQAEETDFQEQQRNEGGRDEITLEDVARDIRAVQEKEAAAVFTADIDFDLEQEKDGLSSDIDLELDQPRNDDKEEVNEPRGEGTEADEPPAHSVFFEELVLFLEQTCDELRQVSKDVDKLRQQIDRLDTQRGRRNRLIAKRLVEVEDIISQFYGQP